MASVAKFPPQHKPAYARDAAWTDVQPIAQEDGGASALATIAYTDEYREATSYLRGIMAAGEHSERALELTAHVISLNPAHYTVWLYRAKTLEALQSDVRAELAWLNQVSLKFIKNYQIWHHRQTLQTLLGDAGVSRGEGEAEFLGQMLDKDAKNYHVWSYRQWLVGHFGLWDDEKEWAEVERRIKWDTRNNSAWNHRWYLAFGRAGTGTEGAAVVSASVWRREMDYAQRAVRLAPQNESPWSYIRGLLELHKAGAGGELGKSHEQGRAELENEIERFAAEFAPLEDPDSLRSTFALDMLAEVYAARAARASSGARAESEQPGEDDGDRDRQRAIKAYELLADRFDTLRRSYWLYKKQRLL